MQWTLWIFMITFCGLNSVQSQERVAPGVPPQHYQQPPSYQGQNMHQVPHQQIPQHQLSQHQVPHQQIPQHQIPQQQVPQHQIPQQQMHQQHQVPQVQQIPEVQQAPTIQQHIPVTNAGTHEHAHSHHDQILNAANADHEKGHIAKHFDVPLDTSKMSEQELQFHYFKMHDSDNNNKLDGCELIKSLIHWHEGDPTNTGEKIFTDEELVALIDPILAMDDTNKDGFIDYPEFVQAQQKGAPAAGQQ